MQNTLFLVIYFSCLIYFLFFAKKKKPYLIMGILFAIIFSQKFFVLTRDEKCGLTLMLSALFGFYDLQVLQKVKGVWRYMIAPFLFGFYYLVADKIF
jgi:hypothetical protein